MKRDSIRTGCATLVLLTVVSLGTRLAVDASSSGSSDDDVRELVRRARHHRRQAARGRDEVVRLHNLSTASAYLASARLLATDARIESLASVDVANLSRGLHDALMASRAAVTSALDEGAA